MYPTKPPVIDLRNKIRTPVLKTKLIFDELQKLSSSSNYSITPSIRTTERERWSTPKVEKLNTSLPPRRSLFTPSRLQNHSTQADQILNKPYWRCPKPRVTPQLKCVDNSEKNVQKHVFTNKFSVTDADLEVDDVADHEKILADVPCLEMNKAPKKGFLSDSNSFQIMNSKNTSLELKNNDKTTNVETEDEKKRESSPEVTIIKTMPIKKNDTFVFTFSEPVIRGPLKRKAEFEKNDNFAHKKPNNNSETNFFSSTSVTTTTAANIIVVTTTSLLSNINNLTNSTPKFTKSLFSTTSSLDLFSSTTTSETNTTTSATLSMSTLPQPFLFNTEPKNVSESVTVSTNELFPKNNLIVSSENKTTEVAATTTTTTTITSVMGFSLAQPSFATKTTTSLFETNKNTTASETNVVSSVTTVTSATKTETSAPSITNLFKFNSDIKSFSDTNYFALSNNLTAKNTTIPKTTAEKSNALFNFTTSQSSFLFNNTSASITTSTPASENTTISTTAATTFSAPFKFSNADVKKVLDTPFVFESNSTNTANPIEKSNSTSNLNFTNSQTPFLFNSAPTSFVSNTASLITNNTSSTQSTQSVPASFNFVSSTNNPNMFENNLSNSTAPTTAPLLFEKPDNNITTAPLFPNFQTTQKPRIFNNGSTTFDLSTAATQNTETISTPFSFGSENKLNSASAPFMFSNSASSNNLYGNSTDAENKNAGTARNLFAPDSSIRNGPTSRKILMAKRSRMRK